jgi:hypothetical protein
MEPKYITFEQAKWLKSKEFDEECRMCIADDDERPLPFNAGNSLHKNSIHPYYSTPEQHQVVEWLFEKHGIWIYVRNFETVDFCSYVLQKGESLIAFNNGDKGFDTPQEAYSAAFDYIKDNDLI